MALVRIMALAWFMALLAGPALVSQPAGSGWHPVGLVLYGLAQWVCHQRVERSFQLAGVPLPVCARCIGIYGGAALVAVATAAESATRRGLLPLRQEEGRGGWVLAAGAAPTVMSVVWEWATMVPVSNGGRALLGAALGLAVGWVCFVPPRPSAGAGSGPGVPDCLG